MILIFHTRAPDHTNNKTKFLLYTQKATTNNIIIKALHSTKQQQNSERAREIQKKARTRICKQLAKDDNGFHRFLKRKIFKMVFFRRIYLEEVRCTAFITEPNTERKNA